MSDVLQRKVSQETIDAYGRINGDNDIIHYDDAYAKARGYPGTLAHGLMIMAYASELAAKRFSEKWWYKGHLSVTWTGAVHPGDKVVVELTDSGEIKGFVGSRQVLVGNALLDQIGNGAKSDD